MSKKGRKVWLSIGRVCPRCPGRLLALYDEGGEGVYLQCDDCGLGYESPQAVGRSFTAGGVFQDRVVTGPVRPATDDDLTAAGWDRSKFTDARDT